MNQGIGDQLANDHFRHQFHFLAQRILDDLILWKLAHDESNQTLETNRVALRSDLIELGLQLRRARINDDAGSLSRQFLKVRQLLCEEQRADAETRGWAMSQALASSATEELRANGVKIERIPPDVDSEIKRMGEKFSREWVRSVGNEADTIFVPYYIK